ncbi:MAG: pro-sigmaK processing inhibitor BofA family protein [Clostridia bacterium]|nr:pro-sigmaK processing inhibitor BofA family protein [Clostridia bacterium]
MKVLGILAVVWLSVCAFVLLILHIKSHRMFKSIFLNAVLSFAVIAIINLTQKFTGVAVPLNWWTAVGSGTLGIPCVFGIVVLQILI